MKLLESSYVQADGRIHRHLHACVRGLRRSSILGRLCRQMLGVSLVVALTVSAMAYAVGPVSGGHFKPAVTFGFWAAGKFQSKEVPLSKASQVIRRACAALILHLIAFSKTDIVLGQFASNGYGSESPGIFSMVAMFLAEVVFWFNRRTARSITHRCARLVEHTVQIQPTTYRALVAQTRST